MTQMVTRCPKCATAFRITSTQLESAKGSVRCGSCLHIFKAQEYLVGSAPIDGEKIPPMVAHSAAAITPAKMQGIIKKEPIKAPSKKPIINKSKALEDEEDTLISDDMDNSTRKESGYDSDSFLEMNLQPKQTTSLFEREIRYDLPKEKEHIDESWADDLLDDDQEPLRELKTQKKPSLPTQQIASGAQDGTTKASKAREPSPSYVMQPPQADAVTAPIPMFSLINEESTQENGSEFSEAFVNATKNTGQQESHTVKESESFAAALFHEEDEESTSQPLKRQIKTQPKMRAVNNSRAALLMNIIPAPIEFTAKKMRNWYQQKLWPFLTLVAAITLLFQVAYFKFDYFSRVEPYRTFYALACPLFDCKVPSLVDSKQIVATNLIVHNNTNAKNSLIVDAIIINKAPFEQPFPDLILAFSTLDDTPVASRRFTPKEYLAGELAGIDHIPSKQPVHISLDIVDPGPEAVNYHMSIAR